jgi:hypothetical protein
MHFLPLVGNAFLRKSEQPHFQNIAYFGGNVFEKRLWGIMNYIFFLIYGSLQIHFQYSQIR